MPRLVDIQTAWNALVPQAQSLGISRVRRWNQVPASIREGEDRLHWLETAIRGHGVDLHPQTATAASALATALETDLEQFTFGVEIECFMPDRTTRRQIAQRLTALGIPTTQEEWNHTTRSYWKIITDGSLGDYTRGTEAVSPILQGSAGISRMRAVMQCLEEMGITVRRSCGFHVHIGAANRHVQWFKNLLRLYGHFEDAIDTITARSRRADINEWARSTKRVLEMPNRAAAIERAVTINQLGIAYSGSPHLIERATGGTPQALPLTRADNYSNLDMQNNIGRYRKVNLAAFWRHGTVEFRQHQGTVNANKAEAWVRFCLRLALAATRDNLALSEVNLVNLAATIAMPGNELAYYQRRATELTRVISERR